MNYSLVHYKTLQQNAAVLHWFLYSGNLRVFSILRLFPVNSSFSYIAFILIVAPIHVPYLT